MSRARYPSDEADKLLLRFPSGMRQRLEGRAKSNFRSMNGEVIAILALALGDESQPATGESLQAAPAAGPDSPALQGGSATHG